MDNSSKDQSKAFDNMASIREALKDLPQDDIAFADCDSDSLNDDSISLSDDSLSGDKPEECRLTEADYQSDQNDGYRPVYQEDLKDCVSEGYSELIESLEDHRSPSILSDEERPRSRPQSFVISEDFQGQRCLFCLDRCEGYKPHKWRHLCANCLCPRDNHEVYHAEFVDIRERVGLEQPDDVRLRADQNATLKEGYTWVPPGLSSMKILEYMEQLDVHKIPKIGKEGEKYRDHQIVRQVPKQDLSEEFCTSLKNDVEQKSFEEFKRTRDHEAIGIGVVIPSVKEDTICVHCECDIDATEVAITTSHTPPDALWHPSCFVCDHCSENLVDLLYCICEQTLYCLRHYDDLKKPRCSGCDQLIFSGEYTKAMEQDWHSEHFCCVNCNNSLTGLRYILREEKAYCIGCYENLFANACEDCKQPIGTDSKDLSYKDRHWHEKCFMCCDCKCSLVDQRFASKDEKLYCANCHDNNFAARCDGCKDIFRAGMKKFEYKGQQWHEQCFCCKVCNQPIGNKSFIPRDDAVVCVQCYENEYAQRCTKCNGVINKGGITYKSTPFHRDCFSCTNCNKILAGEKFTSKEEKPYCADCFGDLFAKKCCRCTKPITGLGGTKFISFEDRHWHSDCFVCYKCNNSLVGRGFLTDQTDILCPECGR